MKPIADPRPFADATDADLARKVWLFRRAVELAQEKFGKGWTYDELNPSCECTRRKPPTRATGFCTKPT